MTTEEAIRACEFWTTNIAETIAIGTTTNPDVGLHFNGEEYQRSGWGKREKVLGWSISVPRTVKDGPFERENLAYRMIVKEIERRRESSQ